MSRASSLLLTVDELAAVLKITPSAVYQREARGTIPGAVRAGTRTLRFVRKEIEDWLGVEIPDSQPSTSNGSESAAE